MRYNYESGYENFKKAQRTYIRSSMRTRVLFHLKIWGYTLLGLVFIATCAPIAFRPGFAPAALAGFLLGCALLGGGVVGSLVWPIQRKRCYRLWNGEDDVLHLYLEVDGPILITGRPGRAESRIERAAVCRVVEDDTLMLLFLGKKKFLYLPKSIGEPAIADVRNWLKLPAEI